MKLDGHTIYHTSKKLKIIFFNLETSSTGDPFYLSDLGSFMSGLSRTFVLPQKTDLTFFDKNLFVKADINSFKLTNPLGVNQFQRMPGIEVRYFINRKKFNFHLESDLANFRKEVHLETKKTKSSKIDIKTKVFLCLPQK